MIKYYLLFAGPDHEPALRADLECETEGEAVFTAVNINSPYGHDLFGGRKFLGRFEAGWGDHLSEDGADLESVAAD